MATLSAPAFGASLSKLFCLSQDVQKSAGAGEGHIPRRRLQKEKSPFGKVHTTVHASSLHPIILAEEKYASLSIV